jgi:hypothetical protein
MENVDLLTFFFFRTFFCIYTHTTSKGKQFILLVIERRTIGDFSFLRVTYKVFQKSAKSFFKRLLLKILENNCCYCLFLILLQQAL